MASPLITKLDELRDAINSESCNHSAPLITYGDGTAPVLNYNIPQTTCFSVYGNIRKNLDKSWFKPMAVVVPPNNFFERTARMTSEQVTAMYDPGGIQIRRATAVSAAPIAVRPLPAVGATRIPLSQMSGGHTASASLGSLASSAQLTSQGVSFHTAGRGSLNIGGVVSAANSAPVAVAAVGRPVATATLQTPVLPAGTAQPVRSAAHFMSDIVKQNALPLFVRGRAGQSKLVVIPKPPQPQPYFMIIEEYRTCSYLGDYGAGKVVKTMSLLPGERTTISVRTYRDKTSTKELSQNVLDSYSSTSMNELENLIGEESGHIIGSTDETSTSYANSSQHDFNAFGEVNMSHSSTDGRSFNGSLGVNVSVVNASIGGGTSHSSTNSFGSSNGFSLGNSDSSTSAGEYSHTGIRQDNVNKLSRALDRHVNESNAHRQLDVNTSTSDKISEGEEEATVRELVNYNKSCTMTTVFRQLQQEYITVTYLANIRIAFCNGYPETLRIVDLENLNNLLKDLVDDTKIEDVKKILLKHYCAVMNHDDDPKQFIEEITVNYGACLGVGATGLGEEEKFWRIKKDLVDTYTSGGQVISVKGVILNVSKQTLRTSSLVADTILGHGEALDCYNKKLQDADAMKAYLENMITLQQMDAIEAIVDPVAKADAYKKVFGNCCETAQTQIIA